jgi:hypothetical protein
VSNLSVLGKRLFGDQSTASLAYLQLVEVLLKIAIYIYNLCGTYMYAVCILRYSFETDCSTPLSPRQRFISVTVVQRRATEFGRTSESLLADVSCDVEELAD